MISVSLLLIDLYYTNPMFPFISMLFSNQQHCCRVMADIEKNVDSDRKSVVIDFKSDFDTVKVLVKIRCGKMFPEERIFVLRSITLLQLMPKNS